nr:hypothetical protein [Paenibacillus sp. Root444D2]
MERQHPKGAAFPKVDTSAGCPRHVKLPRRRIRRDSRSASGRPAPACCSCAAADPARRGTRRVRTSGGAVDPLGGPRRRPRRAGCAAARGRGRLRPPRLPGRGSRLSAAPYTSPPLPRSGGAFQALRPSSGRSACRRLARVAGRGHRPLPQPLGPPTVVRAASRVPI